MYITMKVQLKGSVEKGDKSLYCQKKVLCSKSEFSLLTTCTQSLKHTARNFCAIGDYLDANI